MGIKFSSIKDNVLIDELDNVFSSFFGKKRLPLPSQA
jgi:hypothetical protein